MPGTMTITTDHTTTHTTRTTIITTTTTENPDIKISNVGLRTDLGLIMMSLKLDTTLKFQKCQKSLNKNLMKPNTTKKLKNLNKNKPN